MAVNPPSAEEMARSVVAVERDGSRYSGGTLRADDSSPPDADEALAGKSAQSKRGRSPKKKEG